MILGEFEGKIKENTGKRDIRDSAYYMDPSFIDKWFEPFLVEMLNRYEFSEEREEEIVQTIREVVLNSCSACEEKKDLEIGLTVHYGKEGIVVDLIDQGPGFDYEHELSKKGPEIGMPYRQDILDVRLSRGHGIACLYAFADDFQYYNQGRGLNIYFEL